MIWTEGGHQSAKFQTFHCSPKISPNLYFDRLFLLEVYKISAKKVQRSYMSYDPEESCKIWVNLTCCFKNGKNWWMLTRALKSLTNLHFDWLLLCKVFNVWAKEVHRSYLSWHWRMQNLKKKMTRGLENDMKNLPNIHQSTGKCQNWNFHGTLLSKIENVWG